MALRLTYEDQRVPRLRTLQRRDLRDILDQTDSADHRRWRDRLAVGLVVEAHVPGNDREVEFAAGFGHALDGLHDIAHRGRLFRVAEIEIVRDCNRRRADGGEVSVSLGHGGLAAFIGIGGYIVRVAVGCDGQRLVRAVDADNGCVALRLRTVHRVAHDVPVILFPDPAL